MSSSEQIATVVVNVSGGVIQDVAANKPIRVIVVDYDIDEAFIDVLPTVTDRNARKDKAAVSIPIVDCDPDYVNGIENAVKL